MNDMKEGDDDIFLARTKASFYCNNTIPAHLTTKSGRWYNGYVLKLENEDYLLFNDFKLGELPIFYIEIKEIEKFNISYKD